MLLMDMNYYKQQYILFIKILVDNRGVVLNKQTQQYCISLTLCWCYFLLKGKRDQEAGCTFKKGMWWSCKRGWWGGGDIKIITFTCINYIIVMILTAIIYETLG